MKGKRSRPLIGLLMFLLLSERIVGAQSSPGASRRFDNQYLKITILNGWTTAPSADQKLNLTKGKYLLTINPIFDHASGVEGGRFSEIVDRMSSVDAVTRNIDQPASGAECALYPSERLKVTRSISLGNLYTDSSKAGNGCIFPSGNSPVWFGSFFSGGGSESDYTITLAYNTTDVNNLPKKDSPELKRIFVEAAAMLRTLHLKPPIVVSRVSPQSAPSGATVTVYGVGFTLFNSKAIVSFRGITDDLHAVVAEDGKSLTFAVPTSIGTESCQPSRILIEGFCLPIPPDHVDVNDCPRKVDGSSNFCGIPIPPATYQILIFAGGIYAGFTPFTVTAPKPFPVAISLMYPTAFVSVGDTITVRGSNFTATGNTVRIGSALVSDLSSPDGKSITFRAPEPPVGGGIQDTQTFDASVFNANGESNSISFAYRSARASKRYGCKMNQN
jgi:IPT/TIG domain